MGPSSQKNFHKNRAGGVAQGEGPEFKPQYWKKRERERERPLWLEYRVTGNWVIPEKTEEARQMSEWW
jgi:hypothetical protein